MNNNLICCLLSKRDDAIHAVLRAFTALVFSLCAPLVSAGLTDISNAPLANGAAVQVKPNIMLLMDTSKSMNWTHMPDAVEASGINKIGYKSYQCNTLYYRPDRVYAAPKDSLGNNLAAPTFTAAPFNGFDLAQGVIDLSSSTAGFQAYVGTSGINLSLLISGTSDVAQKAYYYIYSGSQTLSPTTTPCVDPDKDPVGNPSTNLSFSKPATGGGTWTRVLVGATSGIGNTDERANFAMWYTYYRSRLNLTKSAVSSAFAGLDNNSRVGFIALNPKTATSDTTIDQTKYLAIADFDATQKAAWFNKLTSQVPYGSSPALEGLARVGRHYANKHDGINGGMNGDPVQYACQQNFTILTTDGVWNKSTESTPNGGPVQLDGVTLVGQQDGDLSDPLSPRPIWDGSTNKTVVKDERSNRYAWKPCTSTSFLRNTQQNLITTKQLQRRTIQNLLRTSQVLESTKQELQNTVQNLASTSQIVQSTAQKLQSTQQNLQSSVQVLRTQQQTNASTNQNTISTIQNRQSTQQNLQTTAQNRSTITQITQTTSNITQTTAQRLQSTQQNLESTSQLRQSTTQRLQSTVQNRESTVQNLQSNTQNTQSTAQNLSRTVQNLASTTQDLASTSQLRVSTSQVNRSTNQNLVSTAQTRQTDTYYTLSTSQVVEYDARTETGTPVIPPCITRPFISCQTTNTGPTRLAYVIGTPPCTVGTTSASASNNYTSSTCSVNATGPTAVQTCTQVNATSGNNYVGVSCTPNNTGPIPAGTCSPSAASAGNLWTSTTCPAAITTGPAPVASCSPSSATSGNSWTSTSCNTTTTGPTGVASCVSAAPVLGNGYTTTACNTATTGPIPVQTCTNAAAGSGNSYTQTTCTTNNMFNVPVASCSASSESAGNSWVMTTCPAPVMTANAPVSSCTNIAANSGNGYIQTICSTNNTGPAAIQTCTPVTATSMNGWITTSCGNNNSVNVPVQTCTTQTGNMTNSWLTIACPAPLVTTNVPVASCTAQIAMLGNSWLTRTCPAAVTTTNVPVASCSNQSANAGNSWTTTTCANNNTSNVPTGSCAAASASMGNSWTAITCNTPTTTNVPVASCTPQTAAVGNSWFARTCPAALVTTNVPVSSCTPQVASIGNSWTTFTCANNNVGPTSVPSCVPSSASAGNSWTATTCGGGVLTGPTPVASCVAVAASAMNGFVQTSCNTITNTTGVSVCVPVLASAMNNWTATTCPGILTIGPIPVLSCTPAVAGSGNSWTTTTCPPPNTTTNVPVASCAPSAATLGNSWVATTCPLPVTTGPTPIGTCIAVAASMGNAWTATNCGANTSGPTPVASCTNTAASPGNLFTSTTCSQNDTFNVPVGTCTPSGPTMANSYTTTTCPAPITTTNVPVGTCTPQIAAIGNSWTTTTCPLPLIAGPAPVPTCTNALAAVGNTWTATTCSGNNTSNVPAGTCTPSGPTMINSYTTTSCATNTTSNIAVASCTAQSASAVNSWTVTTCPAAVTTSNVPVPTCTPSGATAGNSYVTTTCPAPNITLPTPKALCTAAGPTVANNQTQTVCMPVNTGPTPVLSCGPVSPSSGNNWVTTTCPPPNDSGWIGVVAGSCNAASANSGNSFMTIICNQVDNLDVPVASCTPSLPAPGNSYKTTECPAPITTGPTLVGTCTAVSAIAGPSFIAATCASAPGQKQSFVTTSTTTTTETSNLVIASVVVTGPNDGPSTDLDGVCYPDSAINPVPSSPVAQGPALPTDGIPVAPLPPLPVAPCMAWPCSTPGSGTGGSSNSLADVAQYYYKTDLRPSMDDIVKLTGIPQEGDWASWQHMTTFVLGLGVSGTIQYSPNYQTDVSIPPTDFQKIKENDTLKPQLGWPTWPNPANLDSLSPLAAFDDPRSIDDFWHTAVNGRGQFFSAASPDSVTQSFKAAFSQIGASLGAGGAAASSTAQPTQTNNFIYSTSYTTVDWTGELKARRIDPDTGVLAAKPEWMAQELLDAKTNANCDNRTIYLYRQGGGSGTNMVNFASNTSACDAAGNPTGAPFSGLSVGEMANFNASKIALLSQYGLMTDGTSGKVDQLTPAAGDNLVNFLRGQRGFEDFFTNIVTKLYRKRAHVLGDIASASATYVEKPTFNYGDTGYAAYKTSQSTRKAMLYVGANDGMMHAFNAGSLADNPLAGQEAWAFIPTMVLPNLYKLADDNYKNKHSYSVDATGVVGDVYDGSNWKTILVAGLNAGGKGYFAMDVSDPNSPKALWEFKQKNATCYDGTAATADADCYVGLTFGRPIISKLGNQWVVFVTSGYNNVSGNTLDGHGFLYALDAITGKIVMRLDTNTGTATDPSGLAQLTNFVDNADVNNRTLRLYGGDLLGNLWRFDVDGATNTGTTTLIATAKDAVGTPQPITTRPRLVEVSGKTLITIGTGRLLGDSDLSVTQQQSVYNIPDDSTTPITYTDLRAALTPLALSKTGTGDATKRQIACATTGTGCMKSGWFVDLQPSVNPATIDLGARVNVDIAVQSGTTTIPVNIPNNEACKAGGDAYLLFLNTTTGLQVGASSDVSSGMYSSLIAGMTELILTGNQYAILLTLRNSDTPLAKPPVGPPNPIGKRISWREVLQ